MRNRHINVNIPKAISLATGFITARRALASPSQNTNKPLDRPSLYIQ
ncbi:MAG: hypothetical protein OXI61_16770 [Candidatus Poribacteria bacterium]|nr:hypothetical protein [Candidatus Poribacteria bacterium]